MKKAAMLIALFVLVLGGCSAAAEEYSTDMFAMDTYMTVRFRGGEGKNTINKLREEIRRLEALFSVNDSNSDIARINCSDGNKTPVSEDTLQVVEKAVDISQKTDGSLDITIYPVLAEWGFTKESRHIPEKEKLDGLLKNVDYRRISLDKKEGTITVPKGYMLDLGAVAKGYLGDRLCSILREQGVKSALLDLGGNIQTIGVKQDGSLWRVGIKDPRDISSMVCTVAVRDKAVITSGSYERFFVGDDGKKYWHIIDPETGFPADNGLCSVTVIGDSGTECDGLSTALFVMGKEKAVEYCRKNPHLDAVLIDNDEHLYITSGIAGNAEFRDDVSYTVIGGQEEQ